MLKNSKPLEQIVVRNPSTIGAAAFSAYLRGLRPENTSVPESQREARLSSDEYFILSANMSADHVTEYRPRSFLPIAPTLAAYVKARLEGTRDRDPDLGARLGVWVMGTLRTADHNDHSLKHLVWARSWLLKVNLKNRVEKIEQMIGEFGSLDIPDEQYSAALQVQVLDANSRQMGNR
jgi:hypothetical protein